MKSGTRIKNRIRKNYDLQLHPQNRRPIESQGHSKRSSIPKRTNRQESLPKIMVVGNHTWDHMWELNGYDPSTYKLEKKSETLDDYLTIGPDGGVQFKDDVVLSIRHDGKDRYYDPIEKEIGPGQKHNSNVTDVRPDKKRVLRPKIPIVSPGGGGYHLTEAISAMSAIPLQYIGPCHNSDVRFEQQLNAVATRDHILLDYVKNVTVNIVIPKVARFDSERKEVVLTKNRMIYRGKDPGASFARKRLGIGKGTLMVNSVKDKNLGMQSIDEAVSQGNLGIIAMTTSSPKELLSYALQNGFIPIFSNEDIEKYTGISIKNPKSFIDYWACIQALKKVREEQQNYRIKKTRIYLTLGKEGSICLDEHDLIHRIEAYFAQEERNNTGAGDAFAASVTMLEHLQRYEPARKPDVPLTLQQGAALARTKLAESEMNPSIVDNTLLCNHINDRGPMILGDLTMENANTELCPGHIIHAKSHTDLNRILGRYSKLNPERR